MINKDRNGKILPSTEVPEEEIIQYMSALEDMGSPVFKERLQYVTQVVRRVLPKADNFPCGRAAIEEVLQDFLAFLD